MSEKSKWTSWHTFGLLAIIVAIALFGLLIPAKQIRLAWLLTLGGLVLFSMVAGHGITGRFWLGWLINEQYRMSLSRLQMFLWTVVVLSAFLTAALANIRGGYLDSAVAIAIPQQVWIAMGISTTSLVGSPLILSQKKRKKTNIEEAVRTADRVGLLADVPDDNKEEVAKKHYIGQLHRNEKPEDARLYDLVSGEEVSNHDILDLTRLQNLFFTLILIGAYGVLLGSTLLSAGSSVSLISKFPPLDESSIALLGISHAGYLATKAVDKQKEGPPEEEKKKLPRVVDQP